MHTGGVAAGVLPFGDQHQVRVVHRHDGLYAVHGLDGFQVVLRQAQGGEDTGVVHAALVVVVVGGYPHVPGGGQQPRQKAHAQGHNGQNGQEPGEGALYGAEDRFSIGLVHGAHHSISSTGVGCLFTSLEMALPLLMRITRSAMAVRALLWVMTITVRPVLRQVSCKSCKTALPVL